jgi:uncharacterized spore protein YtfJ
MSSESFEPVKSIVETFREHAGAESVYGTPIVVGDRTVVPVARVRYGFGGGFGRGGDGGDEEGGSGGGVGGGLSADPLGIVELDATRTRFVRFGGYRRFLAVAGLGVALGYLLGRRGR